MPNYQRARTKDSILRPTLASKNRYATNKNNSTEQQNNVSASKKSRSKSRNRLREDGTLTITQNYISTLGQNSFKCKFIRSGDYHHSGLKTTVSEERFCNMNDLVVYLTRRLLQDGNVVRGSASCLPKGIRSIFAVLKKEKTIDDTISKNALSHTSSETSNNSNSIHQLYGKSDLIYLKIHNLSDFAKIENDQNQSSRMVFYLCSSSGSNIPNQIDRQTVKILQKKKTKDQNRRQKFNVIGGTSSPKYASDNLKSLFMTRDAQLKNIIHPKKIFVVKPGPRPRVIKQFLLNSRTAHSFEQVLDDINVKIEMEQSAIYKVFNLKGKQIKKLADFFESDDDKTFLVYGNKTRYDHFSPKDCVLDNMETAVIHNIFLGPLLNLNTSGQSSATCSSRATNRKTPISQNRGRSREKFGAEKKSGETKKGITFQQSTKTKGQKQSKTDAKKKRAQSQAPSKKTNNKAGQKRSKSVKPEPSPQSLSANLPEYISKKYKLVQMIGIGNFAEVQLAQILDENSEKEDEDINAKNSNNLIALKIIDKSKKLSEEHEIINEATMLKTISENNHPNIIHLFEYYEISDRIFLALDYISGGDLFDVIATGPKFSEFECVHLLLDLIRATRFLHSKKICHRDIKPENCLLYFSMADMKRIEESGDAKSLHILQATLKLTDFGLATYLDNSEPLRMVCGSPTYVAPEIIYQDEEGYSIEVDMWAIGIISYILLCEKPPYISSDGSQDSLFDAILSGEYSWPEDKQFSNMSVHFVSMLLRIEPEMRMSANEAIKHPWISKYKNSLDRESPKGVNYQVSENTEIQVTNQELLDPITNNKFIIITPNDTSIQDNTVQELSVTEVHEPTNEENLISTEQQLNSIPSERVNLAAENEIENLLNNLQDDLPEDLEKSIEELCVKEEEISFEEAVIHNDIDERTPELVATEENITQEEEQNEEEKEEIIITSESEKRNSENKKQLSQIFEITPTKKVSKTNSTISSKTNTSSNSTENYAQIPESVRPSIAVESEIFPEIPESKVSVVTQNTDVLNNNEATVSNSSFFVMDGREQANFEDEGGDLNVAEDVELAESHVAVVWGSLSRY